MKLPIHAMARKIPSELVLQEEQSVLDRRTRRLLAQHLQEMMRIAHEAAASQAAASSIYYRTLATVDTTMSSVELLKALRPATRQTPVLEELDEERHAEYLKTVNAIAEHANALVVKRHRR